MEYQPEVVQIYYPPGYVQKRTLPIVPGILKALLTIGMIVDVIIICVAGLALIVYGLLMMGSVTAVVFRHLTIYDYEFYYQGALSFLLGVSMIWAVFV